jgi:tRNA pseudouridine38-40 synthase
MLTRGHRPRPQTTRSPATTSPTPSSPGDPHPVPLVRVRIDLAYDGTDFSGWAFQPGRRTVQATLQDALTRLLPVESVALTVAGRTDAGVHATGQVAHADLPAVPEVRRLNAVLPQDVRVRSTRSVSVEFDARFAALWRRYEYRLTDAPADPRRRRFVLSWTAPLDVGRMQEAAAGLVGLHDFAAYCRHRPDATTLREIRSLDIARVPGDEISVTVQADAFCQAMVRSLVGALLAVGDGRRPSSWPALLLNQTERCGEVAVAPAHGLTLVQVGYPPAEQWAERAALTRHRRDQVVVDRIR